MWEEKIPRARGWLWKPLVAKLEQTHCWCKCHCVGSFCGSLQCPAILFWLESGYSSSWMCELCVIVIMGLSNCAGTRTCVGHFGHMYWRKNIDTCFHTFWSSGTEALRMCVLYLVHCRYEFFMKCCVSSTCLGIYTSQFTVQTNLQTKLKANGRSLRWFEDWEQVFSISQHPSRILFREYTFSIMWYVVEVCTRVPPGVFAPWTCLIATNEQLNRVCIH